MVEKIDFVITYLDGEDPKWLAERDFHRNAQQKGTSHENGNSRYRSMGNFHLLLRSIEKFAPWVNKIHIVTWGHIPEWLNTEHPKINVVNHRDFIPEDCLPTFNSNAIEFSFDKIPGIADYFVYVNDDVFFNVPTEPTDFFVDGKPKLQLMHAPFMPTMLLFANNTLALNQIVDKKHLLSKKMLSVKNGIFAALSNLYMLPLLKFYGHFLGFREDHLTMPLTKASYKVIKEKLPDHVDFVSHSKFRNTQDGRGISVWMMMDYARATNEFVPMNSFKFGRLVNLGTDVDFKKLFHSKYKILCLEDGDFVSEEDFPGIVAKMNAELERKFPVKSGFEK
ncbi:glycosyl transferase [Lactococcus garvieae]|uniref:Glycosyltransferase n=1 Tax=Lactococcus garvieae DCC43 TaxID=1231377 RepID=K2QGH0_9LACT|nr:glycosyl transferase [Lactococcus garvieae]EKF52582.1 glycosyltransferase [Lactococcus garvieae DCC43]